ncbi:MAG: hypothetical protein ACP5NI_11160, partial [Acetobacteraceae bacterium]
MIKAALAYIRTADDAAEFVGCATMVEGDLLLTCHHVWRTATGGGRDEVIVEYPHASPDASRPARGRARLFAPGIGDDEEGRDFVLLRPEAVPPGVEAVSLARDAANEFGPGRVLAGLIGLEPSRPEKIQDVAIEGQIGDHIDSEGLRRFTGSNSAGYFPKLGASGSPVFVKGGEQLAGILRLSETGQDGGIPHLREAFLIPASKIRPYLRQRIAAEAVNQAVPPERLAPVLAAIGADDIPTAEIPERLLAFVRDAQERGARPPPQSIEDPGLAATIGAARDRLKALDPAGALALLQAGISEEASAHTRRLRTLLRERAAVERLSFAHDAAKATLAELTRLDPDDVWAWIELGDIARATGSLSEAEQAYRAADAAARRSGDERDVAASHSRTGGVLLA